MRFSAFTTFMIVTAVVRSQEGTSIVIDDVEIDEFFPPLGWSTETLGEPGFGWFAKEENGIFIARVEGQNDVDIQARLISPIYDLTGFERVSVLFSLRILRPSSSRPFGLSVIARDNFNNSEALLSISEGDPDEIERLVVSVPRHLHNQIARIAFEFSASDQREGFVELSNLSIVGLLPTPDATPAPNPIVSVLFPVNGTVWRPGGQASIHWAMNPELAGTGPKFELWAKIADLGFGFDPSGEQVTQVNIPEWVPPGNQYRVRVESTWNPRLFGESDGFVTIDPNAESAVPDGGWELYE